MCFLTMFLVLFLIMDPIGNISSFLNVLDQVESERRTRVMFREMFIALGFMLFFNLIGRWLLNFLGISPETVLLASGIILFLAAMGILYPNAKSVRNNLFRERPPFITPLAVPLIAGPPLLATIILFAQSSQDLLCRTEAILLAWSLSVCILYFGRSIKNILTPNGLSAAERLVGMVLILIAIQRFTEGLKVLGA